MRAFTLSVPRLPNPIFHPISYFEGKHFYESLAGVLDYHCCSREMMILVFATVGHAEKARKALLSSGNWAGKYILNADYSREPRKLKIYGPVEGWPEGWVADA